MFFRNISFLLLIVFFSAATNSQAEGTVYIVRGLNFGRIIPATHLITVSLDATGTGKPVCVPASDCQIINGWSALLEFQDFGNYGIQLNYPSETILYTVDKDERVARILRMTLLSDQQAHLKNGKIIAEIGGELHAGSEAHGTAIQGSLVISITTF